MNTVLLPVKDFSGAKQRLSSLLNAERREGLARAMFQDVLDALTMARTAERIVVYTASERVARAAKPFGVEVLAERAVSGHSAAVNSILPRLAATSTRVLAIASDLPLLCGEDVDKALNAPCASVAILPSRDGTGTNGIMVAAGCVFEVAYGEGSFQRHWERAVRSGMSPIELQIGGVAFDIDTPEDLRAYLNGPREGSETWRFLKHLQ